MCGPVPRLSAEARQKRIGRASVPDDQRPGVDARARKNRLKKPQGANCGQPAYDRRLRKERLQQPDSTGRVHPPVISCGNCALPLVSARVVGRHDRNNAGIAGVRCHLPVGPNVASGPEGLTKGVTRTGAGLPAGGVSLRNGDPRKPSKGALALLFLVPSPPRGSTTAGRRTRPRQGAGGGGRPIGRAAHANEAAGDHAEAAPLVSAGAEAAEAAADEVRRTCAGGAGRVAGAFRGPVCAQAGAVAAGARI